MVYKIFTNDATGFALLWIIMEVDITIAIRPRLSTRKCLKMCIVQQIIITIVQIMTKA